MYSLYRAWLSMSQPPSELPSLPSLPSLPLNLSAPPVTSNAPDVQLQVGPSLTNFSAHRNVLSAHSGFFKAALNNFSTSSAGPGGPIGPILVPNIAVDEFSSLLTFMYTGYLDLNLGNIYNILLATHILHMPRALELCRNFLMQTQHQQQQLECHPVASTSASTSIIKPIASRKPLPNIEALSTLVESVEGKEVEKKLFNNSSVFKIYHNVEKPAEEIKMVEDSEPSTSAKVAKVDKVVKPAKKDKKRRISSSLIAQQACTITEERVIIDIACCDGPVRFHRVVNKNYGRKTQTSPVNVHNEESTHKKRNTLAAINKIMTENIKLANIPNPDNKEEGENATQPSSQPTADLYTCLYCNHTFKSQYCYQKHARRHLNPVDAVKTPPESSTGGEKQSTSVGNTKREFKLLDMNVQYYPCKTCGSKFPSYYFVHKHRKLCHADEMADGSNKNNEIIQVKPKGGKKTPLSGDNANVDAGEIIGDVNAQEDTTGSDIIDVEETN